MKRILLLLACAAMMQVTIAQQGKQTAHLQQVWMAYNNQTRLSSRWGLWADVHLRTKEEFVTDFSQFILRGGLMYYLNDNTKLTAGYAFVNHFPADNHAGISQPEHRPWQQLQWHTRYAKARTMQWIRLEERYRRKIAGSDALAEGYNFNYRLRYNILLTLPLGRRGFNAGSTAFVLNDEVHINFGKEVVYNYFDQNRFFIGLAYQTNARDNLQFGYMNLFQQLAAGNRYRSIHALRLYYFHNVDLRKKGGK